MIQKMRHLACCGLSLLGACNNEEANQDAAGAAAEAGNVSASGDLDGVCPESNLARRSEQSCPSILAQIEQRVVASGATQAFEARTWAGLPEALQVMPPDGELCGARGPARDDGTLNTDSGTIVTVTLRSAYCAAPLVAFYDGALKGTGCGDAEVLSSNSSSTAATWDCFDAHGTGPSVVTVPSVRAVDVAFTVP